MSKSSKAVVTGITRRAIQALVVGLVPLMVWAGPVDINKADAATIAKELSGIGMVHAQAIVAYREKNGAFKGPADLAKVKGVGMKVVERNKANLRFEGGKG